MRNRFLIRTNEAPHRTSKRRQLLGRRYVLAQVGMPVMVDLAGFHRWGITVRQTTPTSGTIVALGSAGITVKLDAAPGGLDTITVGVDRVTAVQ